MNIIRILILVIFYESLVTVNHKVQVSHTHHLVQHRGTNTSHLLRYVTNDKEATDKFI